MVYWLVGLTTWVLGGSPVPTFFLAEPQQLDTFELRKHKNLKGHFVSTFSLFVSSVISQVAQGQHFIRSVRLHKESACLAPPLVLLFPLAVMIPSVSYSSHVKPQTHFAFHLPGGTASRALRGGVCIYIYIYIYPLRPSTAPRLRHRRGRYVCDANAVATAPESWTHLGRN